MKLSPCETTLLPSLRKATNKSMISIGHKNAHHSPQPTIDTTQINSPKFGNDSPSSLEKSPRVTEENQ